MLSFCGIDVSKDRLDVIVEAREQLPELRRHYFGAPADEFVPFYALRTRIGQWV